MMGYYSEVVGAIFVLWLTVAFASALVQTIANTSAGVVADWYGLRVTRTELIQGYGPTKNRLPLMGLSARVEENTPTDSRRNPDRIRKAVYRRISVVVSGGGTSIERSRLVFGTAKMINRADEFVEALNTQAASQSFSPSDDDSEARHGSAQAPSLRQRHGRHRGA